MDKTTFLNEPTDCEWLRDVHLGGRTDYKFKSFVLYGNEDAPTKVDLYFTTDPLVTDDTYLRLRLPATKGHTITFI